MSVLKIKVCGITRVQQVRQLVELGVEYAGFIFYKKSPRYVVGKIVPQHAKSHADFINTTGVFVNEEYDTILKTVDEYGLKAVQLHGGETPEFCARLSVHVNTIKAFRIGSQKNISELIQDYNGSVNYFLFDTMGEGYGGTGKKFDWDTLQHTKVVKPFFLSGGIGPGDGQLIKKFVSQYGSSHFYAVDVNSKFETVPGVKNFDLLDKIIREIK